MYGDSKKTHESLAIMASIYVIYIYAFSGNVSKSFVPVMIAAIVCTRLWKALKSGMEPRAHFLKGCKDSK